MDKVALITNIPRPYRVPLYNALGDRIVSNGGDFKVFYYSDIHKNIRRKGMQSPEGRFQNETVPTFEIRLGYERVISIPVKLLGRLDRYKPNLVICGSFGIPGFLTWNYSVLKKIPYIQWTGETLDSNKHGRWFGSINQKKLARNAHACLTYGSFASEYMEKMGIVAERISTGVNVIDNLWYMKTSGNFKRDAESFKKRYGLHGIFLLYVGNLVPLKGIDLLIKSFGQLNKNCEGVHLNIVGKGPFEPRLRELSVELELGDRIHFWGAYPPEIVPQFYAMADIFIFPSLYDVWGLVVNEAMACGLPVIGSCRTGAVRDLVQDGVNGFVIDPMDIIGFAEKMGELIRNPELRVSMGAAALETVNQKATIEKSVSCFLEAIRIAKSTYRN